MENKLIQKENCSDKLQRSFIYTDPLTQCHETSVALNNIVLVVTHLFAYNKSLTDPNFLNDSSLFFLLNMLSCNKQMYSLLNKPLQGF